MFHIEFSDTFVLVFFGSYPGKQQKHTVEE